MEIENVGMKEILVIRSSIYTESQLYNVKKCLWLLHCFTSTLLNTKLF